MYNTILEAKSSVLLCENFFGLAFQDHCLSFVDYQKAAHSLESRALALTAQLALENLGGNVRWARSCLMLQLCSCSHRHVDLLFARVASPFALPMMVRDDAPTPTPWYPGLHLNDAN